VYRASVGKTRQQLTMLANFVEVRLAKEGHGGLVGINLLTKVQLPNLASLYGAMLGGVDYVLMGAGIPQEIPGVLDALAEHRLATLKLDVQGAAAGEPVQMTLDPREHWEGPPPDVRRPRFVAVIASNSLATVLARKATGRVDGFVVEKPAAGGHNAPPRGTPQFNEQGEPLYGPRDDVDLVQLRELGLPFWVAGGTGSPEALAASRAAGAVGIQVGTLFAYCQESGLADDYKRSVLARAARGEVDVYTDPRASPTGYPFKVVRWPDDPAPDAAERRERVCDLGYLRTVVVGADGRLDYRCSAEPVDAYLRKGGAAEDTVGRRCLCNALMANVGHPQVRKNGRIEPPLITSGDDLKEIARFSGGRLDYTAAEVIDYLVGSTVPVSDPRQVH
jgi:NAD(P)H-dependent flavin oxidoreductase YrpB (nitropropane dioxygenase family)